jgi:hypothetical protein
VIRNGAVRVKRERAAAIADARVFGKSGHENGLFRISGLRVDRQGGDRSGGYGFL